MTMRSIVPMFALSVLLTLGCDATAMTTAQADHEMEVEDSMNRSEWSQSGNQPNRSGWSQSGTLTTGDTAQFVSMQKDLEAREYTVQFAISPPATGCETEALVTWVVNGAPVQRRITVGQGAALTGLGQNVKIQIFDTTNTTTFGFAAGKKYGVSVSVSPGSRGTDQQPPILVPAATIVESVPPGSTAVGPGTFDVPANTGLVLPIPQGVGIKSIFAVAVAIGAAPPEIKSNSAGVSFGQSSMPTFSFGTFPLNLGVWIPVPPGADQLDLANDLAANHVLFSIYFGIEG